MRMPRIFFFLLLAFCFSAEADIYRCNGEFGEPYYAQQPCGDDAVVAVSVKPSVASGPAQGIRPGERAWLEQRHRNRSGSRKTKRPSRVSSAASRKATRNQAYRCRKKRRALDAVRAKLRRGYKPASGEKLRRRRAAHEDYLATFCS